MKLIKGMIIGAAAGYAYASSVSKDKRKEQMDRLVTTVKSQSRPVTEAVSTGVRALTDSAANRMARSVVDAGTAAEEGLESDTTAPKASAVPASTSNGSPGSLNTEP